MKITKRQLRRIIVEEKQKLNEVSQLDYIMGSSITASFEETAENMLFRIWGEVFQGAVDEDLDDAYAAELAGQALVKIVARTLDSAGETQFAHELKRYLP
jgi:hypothetical protein